MQGDLCISCLHEAMKKLPELNTFQDRKTTVSSRNVIRLRFQGHRCKSVAILPSLKGSTLEITLTVPLKGYKFIKKP